jgi:molybdate transport system substrate-binding protein
VQHLVLALLTIAAASDLQPVLPRLVAAFERETGHTVRTTYGSSGNFLTQIRNGAPFDLFLSADIDYPRQLEAAGLAEPATVVSYATGSIVLWARHGSGIDVRSGWTAAVTSDHARRIAIANPDHAPYGRAAVAALRSAGLYERVRVKLVFGENVAQAAQFVQSGNADIGILPLSLALSPALKAAGEYASIPPSLYPSIEQGAVVLRASRNKDAARAFLRYLQRSDVVSALAGAGFGPAAVRAAR